MRMPTAAKQGFKVNYEGRGGRFPRISSGRQQWKLSSYFDTFSRNIIQENLYVVVLIGTISYKIRGLASL